mmetsp:Transcript_11845/g.30039  ORF Transcript_11845/g.30039 Transcript_11845/m.30039 type:complete len:104 (+) Transcript_11845:1384-1695(+)
MVIDGCWDLEIKKISGSIWRNAFPEEEKEGKQSGTKLFLKKTNDIFSAHRLFHAEREKLRNAPSFFSSDFLVLTMSYPLTKVFTQAHGKLVMLVEAPPFPVHW